MRLQLLVLLFLWVGPLLAQAQSCSVLQQVDTRYQIPTSCISSTPGATCGPNGRFAGPCNCTCACDAGWGGARCDLSITNLSAPKPTSPFGFSRVLRRRGLQQTLGPLILGRTSDSPVAGNNGSFLFPQFANQQNDGMFEYTIEMWILPVLNSALETNQTGFTAFEMRLTLPRVAGRIYAGSDGSSICGTTFQNLAPGCDARRNAVIYTHEKGWMWNYGYQLLSAWRFHNAIFTPTFDMDRLRVRSGVPMHIAVTFQAISAISLGPKSQFDDQVATLYVNGIRVGSTPVFTRQPSELFSMFFGPWLGIHPNATSRTVTITEVSSLSLDARAVEGMSIDEVRIWRRPLSQREIMNNMYKPLNTSSPDLLVYWNFDDADPQQATNANTNSLKTIADSQGRDWNGYVYETNSTVPDKYFGVTSRDEGIFPLFENSFVPTNVNWSDIIPPNARVTLDAETIGPSESPLGFPNVHFGAMSALIGRKFYMYGGAEAASSFAGSSGNSKLFVWDLDTKKWQPTNYIFRTPGGQAIVNGGPGLFGSGTIVDGSRIWLFGGSFGAPSICYIDTEFNPVVMSCDPNDKWTTLVGSIGGMAAIRLNRTVWMFGGAFLSGGNLFPSDPAYAFDLDTRDVRVLENPGGTAVWPQARIFSCLAPYGGTRAVMYGGITGLQDQGQLKQMYLLDPTATSAQSLWTIFPVDSSVIPTVAGWSSCVALPNTLLIHSGTIGVGIASIFSLTTAASEVPQPLKYDTLTILRLNESDPTRSSFETINSENGYEFAGGLIPLRLGHATALTSDGSHLITATGLSLDTRAEIGDKAEVWSERSTYYVRLGCPAGSSAGPMNDSDPFSFNCVLCPPDTYQPVSYAKNIVSTVCLPCPIGTNSSTGSLRCEPKCDDTTVINLTTGLCEPCPAGFKKLRPEELECIYPIDARPPSISDATVTNIVIAIGAVFGTLGGIAAAVGIFFLVRFARRIASMRGKEFKPEDFNFAFLKATDIEFGEELGSGSFGTVFKGTYNGRSVAIKVSKPGVEEALRDFLREAEVMMKIEPHPNVIQLIGVALSGGSALVLLEFVDGGSLDRLLRKGHEFSPEELPEFLGQITSGLAHIHKANLVHRDLAARNILLSRDPESGRYIPKIADFGLSRQVSEEQGGEGQTKTNFGPVPWMAPEAIGELKYSPESDVWSLGITFWEIVSGLDPAQQMELVDLAIAIRDRGFHPFVPPFLPKYLMTILEGCWQVAPMDRLTLDSISKILTSATTVQPVVVTTNKNKGNKRKTKADGGKEKDIGAEVERLKERLKQLEREIESVLAENVQFEARVPAVSPSRKSGWRTSIKPSTMSNIAVPSRDEVELVNMGAADGGYSTLPNASPDPQPKSPKRKKSVRKPKDADGSLYTSVPASPEGQPSTSSNSIVPDVGDQSPIVPSKVTIIAPPTVDPDSPYIAMPGAPGASGMNAATTGYSTLNGDDEYETIVSPRSGEKRKKKKKKGSKTPRGGGDE